ncbi:hypothetical protein FHR81_002872 [Actinoalloteichus hoggarensis]|uniref:Uncharacterized protein n=1 Tax=Actinoalloteichus hoggarensis TaxID=1470176 RepID=A0A221VY75_9PSEU|nr:hypothetical protein [Actinoalloteichus hoggarensis]ASO18465.1 hypothetical protein AHOG_04045 [Actinoalloteichus hoggarensis]MBB5921832.1 hypothetical protein [Actinoalloteichus hoggarensis]
MRAVQPFSKRLVEDYGYPKSHIQTRPRWHVTARPSDRARAGSYPVDIAVFAGEHHRDDALYLVVECTKPDRDDGRDQREDYLRLSRSYPDVWRMARSGFLRRREAGGTVAGRGRETMKTAVTTPEQEPGVDDDSPNDEDEAPAPEAASVPTAGFRVPAEFARSSIPGMDDAVAKRLALIGAQLTGTVSSAEFCAHAGDL